MTLDTTDTATAEWNQLAQPTAAEHFVHASDTCISVRRSCKVAEAYFAVGFAPFGTIGVADQALGAGFCRLIGRPRPSPRPFGTLPGRDHWARFQITLHMPQGRSPRLWLVRHLVCVHPYMPPIPSSMTLPLRYPYPLDLCALSPTREATAAPSRWAGQSRKEGNESPDAQNGAHPVPLRQRRGARAITSRLSPAGRQAFGAASALAPVHVDIYQTLPDRLRADDVDARCFKRMRRSGRFLALGQSGYMPRS